MRIRRSWGSRNTAGKVVPAGTVAVVRSSKFFASVRKDDRACNIDPPASSYTSCGGHPYRGDNSGPGKDDRGELDTRTRN